MGASQLKGFIASELKSLKACLLAHFSAYPLLCLPAYSFDAENCVNTAVDKRILFDLILVIRLAIAHAHGVRQRRVCELFVTHLLAVAGWRPIGKRPNPKELRPDADGGRIPILSE